jgi:hypothetical protein
MTYSPLLCFSEELSNRTSKTPEVTIEHAKPFTMPLEIIGAGNHRTGTASLRAALDILNFPCHHSFDFALPKMDFPGLGPVGARFGEDGARFFVDIAEGKVDREKADGYFREMTACVDCIYCESNSKSSATSFQITYPVCGTSL